MILKAQFKQYCIDQIEKWFENLKKRNYSICNSIANDQLKLCKEILKKRIWNDDEEENNIAFICGVLFKGFSEFVKLAGLTRNINWPKDNKKTETIWNLMWNCLDRFDFCYRYFKGDDFNWIIAKLSQLESNFMENFGSGLYSSPEILIKKEICSICQQDIRICAHISGELYSGIMCYGVPNDIQIRAISLVTVPRDPRCRMWPWNMKEDRTLTGTVMTFFRIDDWLTDNKK